MEPSAARFDHQRALDATDHFAESTGLACVLIDADGTPLARRSGDDPHHALPCPFCRAFHAATARTVACRDAHLYGAFQSMRFGGRYTYFCPLGLTHIAAPIVVEGRLVASLVLGPILLVDHDDFMSELSARQGLSPDAVRAIEPAAKRVPVVSTRRTRALSEMLLFTASWISGANVRDLVEEEERLSREARVSDYIHDIKTMGGGSFSLCPAETEGDLLAAIRAGDREGAREVLARLLATIRVSAGSDYDTVKARVLELVVLLSRAAIDGGADAESVFGINYRALTEVDHQSTVEALCDWIAGIAERYVQFVFDVRSAGWSDAVIRASRAMRRRFVEKIGLEDIARDVNLSPAYFSRVFKEEMGIGFSSYLNGLRVDRAKRLLTTTDRPILAISLDVGYSDQSHFSRVFRERTGLSPAKFRTASGSIPANTEEIHD